MRIVLGFLIAAGLAFSAAASDVAQPVVSDSRVKTFVYNENEVYPILTHYGYQANIEFGKGEEIQTLSVGDRVAWQIIPAGRRLFIQTLQDDVTSNLTVVTNRRAYQFDLRSLSNVKGREQDIVYVARFYYPDEEWDKPKPVVASGGLLQASAADQYNFNYTLSGPESLSPVKVFDDGRSTFFQFPGGNTPQLLRVMPDGREVPLNVTQQGEYSVVPAVAERFSVRGNGQVVCVFNENRSGH